MREAPFRAAQQFVLASALLVSNASACPSAAGPNVKSRRRQGRGAAGGAAVAPRMPPLVAEAVDAMPGKQLPLSPGNPP